MKEDSPFKGSWINFLKLEIGTTSHIKDGKPWTWKTSKFTLQSSIDSLITLGIG